MIVKEIIHGEKRITFLFIIFQDVNCFIFSILTLLIISGIFNQISHDFMPKYHCPRCGSNNIMEYESVIECLDCNLEFDK